MEDKDYKTDFRLIDPRKVEIDNTTTNFYNLALRECGFKIPLYVAIYNQIRYFEDFGKLKIGYCIQSKETFAEQFGVSIRQVERAFNHLTSTYKLGNWVICDTKIFRNVKKVWVSNVRQKRGTMDEAIRLLQSMAQQESSHNMVAELPQYGSKTTTAWEQNYHSMVVATPELTETESNIKINKRERVPADSADASSALSPFSFSVSKKKESLNVDSDSASRKKLYALCADLLGLMGQSKIKERQKLVSAVKARLKTYSELELREVARWSATQSDDFLKVPSRLFSEGGFEQALVLMSADKKKHISKEF